VQIAMFGLPPLTRTKVNWVSRSFNRCQGGREKCLSIEVSEDLARGRWAYVGESRKPMRTGEAEEENEDDSIEHCLERHGPWVEFGACLLCLVKQSARFRPTQDILPHPFPPHVDVPVRLAPTADDVMG
jgi:hypothetical protein